MSADVYVIHPDYNALTLDNDVGLIWLRLPLTFSGNSINIIIISNLKTNYFYSLVLGSIKLAYLTVQFTA